MPPVDHPESAENLARARRYHAQSVEDLEAAGAERLTWTLTKDASFRLDKYVQNKLKGISRSQIQNLITLGAVTVNGKASKPAQKLRTGDTVEVVVPPKPAEDLTPEDIPLHILYEDDGFIAVNKQAGIIVHPARSHLHGTMLHALAWHFKHHPGNTVALDTPSPRPQAVIERSEVTDQTTKKNKPALSTIGKVEARPGVIHRLDMNTTGVILFGKQNESHWLLAKQFEERTNDKAYLAVVHGNPAPGSHAPPAGTIDAPLGKHPTIREGHAVRHDSTGRHALTLYRVREQYAGYALVEVQIKTGRTHQIRVHMQYLGHPIVGDHLYGGEIVGPREIEDPPYPAGGRPNLSYARPKEEGKRIEALAAQRLEQGDAHPDGPVIMPYPALHAGYLKMVHPIHRHDMVFTAPLHRPMLDLVRELRKHPHPDRLPTAEHGNLIDLSKAVPDEAE